MSAAARLRGLALWAALGALAAAASPVASAQEAPPASTDPTPPTAQGSPASELPLDERAFDEPPGAPDLTAAAERWRALDPERRAELERRFERFRGLDEGQREALRERAGRLREERAALAEALPEPERERLADLPPPVRDSVLRRQQLELARRRGERLREVLPPPFLRDLEQAPPMERPQVLRELRDELREQRLPGLGRGRFDRGPFLRAGLPPEWLDRLRDLAPGERLRGLRDLARDRHRSVLPPAVAADGELRRELERAAIPTVDELLGAGDRPDHEALRARGRERVLSLLRASGRLDEQQLAELEALPAGKLLHGLRPPLGGGPRGGLHDLPPRGRRSGPPEGPGPRRFERPRR